MATTTRTSSPEARRAAMEALHARLEEQVETLRSTQGWIAYVKAAQTFRTYSARNIMLIMRQCPDATDVATFQTWKARGRQVRKGEVSMRIFAPSHARSRAAEDKTSSQEKTAAEPGEARRISGFRPLPVFDISQTDPIEGAIQPQGPILALDRDDDAGLYARLVEHFERTGVQLHRIVIPGGRLGYTRRVPPAGEPKAEEGAYITEVAVDVRSTGADAALTALHEAAHLAGGHLDSAPGDYVAHQGRYEIEAESAAYIVAGIAGLDTGTSSSGYVAAWHSDAEAATLRATAETALKIAKTLTAALGLDRDQEPAAQNQRENLAA